MAWIFFFLPFFMLGGAAWQGLGFYLFALLLPWLWVKKNANTLAPHTWQASLGLLGASLALMYATFPLINGLNCFLAPGASIAALITQGSSPSLSALLHSRFSSALLASGVFCWILFAFLRRYPVELKPDLNEPQPQKNWHCDPHLLAPFTRGMAVACSILAVYLAIQHLTGFDYKEASWHLADAKKLSDSGTYRTLGFYGHPLSLAAACLAIFSYFLTLLFRLHRDKLAAACASSSSASSSSASSGPGLSFPYASQLYTYIACLNFLFILLSGGRTAITLAFLLVLAYPFGLPLSSQTKSLRLVWTVLALIAGLAFMLWSGMHQRYEELFHPKSLTEANLGRPTFWRVYWAMFIDKPWFGHGSAWINTSVRTLYYQRLGLGGYAHQYNAHNLYLEILANVGIVGSSALVLGVAALVRALKNLSLKGQSPALFQAFLVALVGNLAHGLTQNTLFDSNVLYIYLYFLWLMIWTAVSYNLRGQKA